MPDPSGLAPELRAPVGAFVTLEVGGELNGCIGSIRSEQPLGVSVARHAWSAAFSDPRLPPLRWDDYEHLAIEISMLSPLTAIEAGDRDSLLDTLRPGVDGLLIAAGSKQAVFLPAVWDQLPSAELFLAQLFLKAGLSPNAWPHGLQAFVFSTHSFGRRTCLAESPSATSRQQLVGYRTLKIRCRRAGLCADAEVSAPSVPTDWTISAPC